MRRTLLPGLLAAALLAAAAPAHGASRLVVRGAGFGHGVGMSQYGALGFANQGADHASILGHYYTGTQLAKLGGPSQVRVLLKRSRRIVFSGAAAVAGGGRELDPVRTYSATRSLSGVQLRSASGRDLGTYESPLTITGAPGGYELRGRAENGVTAGRYRGSLQIRATAIADLSAIDAVDIEEYLRGVVPGEVPPSWPEQALRAQAIAARTFAIVTNKNGDGFDQYADTRSQVYKGVAGEHPSTDAAVAATRDDVVVYDAKPVATYFFSTSGGRTENVENSFLGADPAPWLTSVDDPFDNVAPRHRWVERMSLRSAQRRLGGLVRGSLVRIRVLRRGQSPRVVRAEIIGSGGRTRVSGPQLRSKLGLFDTWARFTVITSKATRGDGDKPKPPAPATGGAVPRSAFAAAARAGHAGAISGRIAPADAGRWATLERRQRGAWVSQFETQLRAGGRYSANVRRPGLYRIRYDGEPGPAVRVAQGRV